MVNDVKRFCFGEEDMDIEKHFTNITDMLSDAMFSYGTDFTVRYVMNKNDKHKVWKLKLSITSELQLKFVNK